MGPYRKRTRQEETDSEHEAEPFDVVKFQAQLEDRLASARALVDSWVPTDLDPAWKESDKKLAPSVALAALESRARPPRLGLGASVSAYHVQQAEDRKLRNQLLGHARKHKALNEDNATPQPDKANALASGEADSEEDEDSRTRSIKSTKKAATPFVGDRIQSINLKIASVNGMSSARDGGAGPSNATASKGDHDKPLTKNQRKKERERLKKLASQEAKLAEIQREENGAFDAKKGKESPATAGDTVQISSRDDIDTDASDQDGVDISEQPTGGASSSPVLGKRRRRRRKSKNTGSTGPAGLFNLGS
ncbi:hypothetical protein OIV83_000987 [Microbotryomycetes sp. JL201]|nr:hypothetical protein OIV83_000987 [Microbotryomycetes sp. JL201]